MHNPLLCSSAGGCGRQQIIVCLWSLNAKDFIHPSYGFLPALANKESNPTCRGWKSGEIVKTNRGQVIRTSTKSRASNKEMQPLHTKM